MAVQSENNEVQYQIDAESLEYPVPFSFFDEEDLAVILTNENGVPSRLVLQSEYVVAGAGSEDGGSVILDAFHPTTSRLTIYREMQATQNTVYAEGSEFPAKSHERALDKLTMLIQQLARSILRSVQVPVSDAELDPVPAVEDSILGFDGAKQPRTYTLEQLISFLNVTASVVASERPMATFSSSGMRAAAIPAFTGQLGTQTDNHTIWIANSTATGDWTRFDLEIPSGTIEIDQLEDIMGSRMLGRTGTGTGPIQEVHIGSGLTLGALSGVPTLYATPADAAPSLSGFRGLRIESASVSTLKINVAEILLSSGTDLVKFTAPDEVTVSITASRINGLDEGVEEASKWYYIWAISDGENFRGMLSLDPDDPRIPYSDSPAWTTSTAYDLDDLVIKDNLLYRCSVAHTSGTFSTDLAAPKWELVPLYNYKQLLGAVRNDGSSHFVDFLQINNDVWAVYKGQSSLPGHASGLQSHSLSAYIPRTAIYVSGNAGTTSGNAILTIAGDTSGLGRCIINHPNTTNFDSFVGGGQFFVPVKTEQTIFYKTNQSSANYSIEVTGWRYA